MGKAILFSTAGILVYTVETRDLRQMGGLWHRMPITAVLWFSAAMILSALPPTSGFVGKWLFFVGAFQKVQTDPIGLFIVVAAILASLMTLIYTFLTGIRIFFGRPNPDLDTAEDPPLTMSIPLICLALLALLSGTFPSAGVNPAPLCGGDLVRGTEPTPRTSQHDDHGINLFTQNHHSRYPLP